VHVETSENRRNGSKFVGLAGDVVILNPIADGRWDEAPEFADSDASDLPATDHALERPWMHSKELRRLAAIEKRLRAWTEYRSGGTL
jgi:hypothetical protein